MAFYFFINNQRILKKERIITIYAPREMTLDEIEKELGYKIKVINKENNDD